MRPTVFRRLALGAALTWAALAAASAQAQIFLCVDAAGHKELTDTDKPGCKKLDVPGAAVTVPGPRRSGEAAPRRATPASSPADFPRVNAAEQRARDDDRRAILQDELNAEQAKLTQLRAEYNNGEPERRGDERNYAKYQERVAQLRDSIGRTEKNIEALRRELANLK